MNKALLAGVLRLALVAIFTAGVLLAVVSALSPAEAGVAPLLGVAVSLAGLAVLLPRADRWVPRIAPDIPPTPYSVLAEAAARIRTGSLDEALPGIAQVLAKGTGARRAEIWLAVADHLVSAARYPPSEPPRRVADLAALLIQPDVDYLVPVLDGSQLRAALAIGKPGRPVTPADQRLMRDMANEAGLLLRGVALNAALRDRVRRAEELAVETQASRQRLTTARGVERARLVADLDNAVSEPLAAIRAHLDTAKLAASPDSDAGPDLAEALLAVRGAQCELDGLLERFRTIARGVYPSVLRDHGPFSALEELVADLPRSVRLSGPPSVRLRWEIESSIYFLAASAIRELAGVPSALPVPIPLSVYLTHGAGRLSVQVVDYTPEIRIEQLRAALAHDGERLTALGGRLEITEEVTDGRGAVTVSGWLPERLEPSVRLSNAPDEPSDR